MNKKIKKEILKKINEQHKQKFKLKDFVRYDTSKEYILENLGFDVIAVKCKHYGCWCAFKK